MRDAAGPGPGYVVEQEPKGSTLVVTGPWSQAAADALSRGVADGLTLNYALGFSDSDIDFLQAWPLRRLRVLDRKLRDLGPIARLSGTLEDLSVQAAPKSKLDLTGFDRLQHLAGPWVNLRDSLHSVSGLRSVITFNFTGSDLSVFSAHQLRESLVLKVAPKLESLSGIGGLEHLSSLSLRQCPRLGDISPLAGLGLQMRVLKFEGCRALQSVDDLAGLSSLTFLEMGNCGGIVSLGPLRETHQLDALYLWGDTRVLDGDLSPLRALPLRDLRVRARKEYRPTLPQLREELARRHV